jgi:O-antigen ligase
VAFFIGLVSLPFLKYQSITSEVARIGGGEASGLANGNVLAMWFGFCSVYFFIVGVETRRTVVRVASWLMSVGCLYVLGLTVSRGPLLGVAIAITFALRRLLKRGFLPVLGLLALSWIILVSGLFESVTAFYIARGAEESGREFLWPLAMERFLNSWPAGVGASDAMIRRPSGYLAGPHNGFLYIALASGVIPLAFFLAYWIRAAKGAFRANSAHLPDAPFQVPLFIFAFLEMMMLDGAFMSAWHVVVLSIATAAQAPRRALRIRGSVIPRYSGHDLEVVKYTSTKYSPKGQLWRS